MITDMLKWKCPLCQARNYDLIDDEEGPFYSCTCEQCGKASDQADVEEIEEVEEA